MDFFLQFVGGAGYLLNKVFFSLKERSKKRKEEARTRRYNIAAWAVYILGLPAWVAIFIGQRNWIAASVEASGAPAMLLGLVIAIRGIDYTPRWLDRFAIACIVFGFAYSLYDFGGLAAMTQWLEVGLVVGFLIGTYRLAKGHMSGYLWFVLMHIACGALMWIQGHELLFWQQVVSLAFIVDAYRTRRRVKNIGRV